MAEAKQHLKSGEHPELGAQKEAAKSQENASAAAAKGHAQDVSNLPDFVTSAHDSAHDQYDQKTAPMASV